MMKKTFSRLIAFIMCIVMLSLTVFAVPEKDETGFTEDDFLCAKGTSIVNAKGEAVPVLMKFVRTTVCGKQFH